VYFPSFEPQRRHKIAKDAASLGCRLPDTVEQPASGEENNNRGDPATVTKLVTV